MPSAGSPLFPRAAKEVMDEGLGRKGNVLNQFVTLIQAINMGLVLIDARGNIVNREPLKMTYQELNQPDSPTIDAATDSPYDIFVSRQISIDGGRPLFILMTVYASWDVANITGTYPTIVRVEDGEQVADGSTDPDTGGVTTFFNPPADGDLVMFQLSAIDEPGNGKWSYKLQFNWTGSDPVFFGLKRAWVTEYESSQFSFFAG